MELEVIIDTINITTKINLSGPVVKWLSRRTFYAESQIRILAGLQYRGRSVMVAYKAHNLEEWFDSNARNCLFSIMVITSDLYSENECSIHSKGSIICPINSVG